MNLENKDNLSNYQLLKRKPSVCSTSLHFSKLITVVQFFFPVTPVLQWFQLNFGAGNFRGRRPGTSALRMLVRLTAVNPRPHASDNIRIHSSTQGFSALKCLQSMRIHRAIVVANWLCCCCCAAILVYRSVRDWTRFCYVIGFRNIRIRCRIRRVRVDGSRNRKEKVADSKISGYVRTGSYAPQAPSTRTRIF